MLAAFGVVFVEEFGMKLDAVNPPPFLLHRLNRAGLVRRSAAKPVRQLLSLRRSANARQ